MGQHHLSTSTHHLVLRSSCGHKLPGSPRSVFLVIVLRSVHLRFVSSSTAPTQLHLLFVLSVVTGYTLVHFVHRGMHAKFSQLFDCHLFLIQSEGFYLFYTTFCGYNTRTVPSQPMF